MTTQLLSVLDWLILKLSSVLADFQQIVYLIFAPYFLDTLANSSCELIPTYFRLVNKWEIQPKDFEAAVGGCLLKASGRKTFVRVFEERLKETILHRGLGRPVSYQHLVKLECYKLTKHLLNVEGYKHLAAVEVEIPLTSTC